MGVPRTTAWFENYANMVDSSTPSTPGAVPFSQETVDKIIDALAVIDSPTLPTIKACAITARAFLSRARHHLFCHIHLGLSSPYPAEDPEQTPTRNSPQRFKSVIEENRDLALLVKSITLAEAHWDITDEGRDPTTGSEKYSADDLEDLICDDGHIEEVFEFLVNLDAVTLKKIRIGYTDWYGHDEPEGAATPDLSHTDEIFHRLSVLLSDKAVRSLTLDRVDFKHRHLLSRFLQLFPHLTSLNAGTSFRDHIFGAETYEAASLDKDVSLVSLDTLAIHFANSECDVRALLDNPFPIDFARLQRLDVCGHSMHTDLQSQDLRRLLDMTQSSLKSASFYFRAFNPAKFVFLSCPGRDPFC